MSCFKCRKNTDKLTPDRGKDKKKKTNAFIKMCSV